MDFVLCNGCRSTMCAVVTSSTPPRHHHLEARKHDSLLDSSARRASNNSLEEINLKNIEYYGEKCLNSCTIVYDFICPSGVIQNSRCRCDPEAFHMVLAVV